MTGRGRQGHMETRLLEVLSSNDATQLRKLLLSGLDANFLLRSRRTSLHWACKHRRFELACVLLETGANVNHQDKYDQTPLHLLSIQENWLNTKNQSAVLKLSELLISYNADVNLKDKGGCTALHYAARCGHTELVRALLKCPTVDVNLSTSCDGQTALFASARSGNCELMQCLLHHGATVHVRSKTGETPLHLAVCFGQYSAALLLLSSGAVINAQSNGGRTPLHWAVYRGHTMCAVLLTQHGADPTLKDWLGVDALSSFGSACSQTAVTAVKDLRAVRPWTLQYICRIKVRTALAAKLPCLRQCLEPFLPQRLIVFINSDCLSLNPNAASR